MKLLIIGAGTFSVEIEELSLLLGYDSCAFVDDDKPNCVGTISDLQSLRTEFNDAIVAMGNNANRKKYTELILKLGYNVPTLIHPTAYVSSDACLGKGCIIRTHAVVSRFAKLGNGVIVNVGGMIDHHCTIGEYSHILMGAVVRNQIVLPELSWIQSNTVAE